MYKSDLRGNSGDRHFILALVRRLSLSSFAIAAICFTLLSNRNSIAAEISYSANPNANNAVGMVFFGKIEVGEAEKFKRVVRTILQSGKWIWGIQLYSPGGSLIDGIEIGRLINRLRIYTLTPVGVFQGDRPRQFICQGVGPRHMGRVDYFPGQGHGDSRCTCASACFFMWAGGYGRNGSVLGVHRFYFDPNDYGSLSISEAKAKYEEAMATQEDYFREMNVPDSVTRRMYTTGSKDIRYLTWKEIEPMIYADPPFLAELITARCGTLTPQNLSCYFRVREEDARQAISQYLKALQ